MKVRESEVSDEIKLQGHPFPRVAQPFDSEKKKDFRIQCFCLFLLVWIGK